MQTFFKKLFKTKYIVKDILKIAKNKTDLRVGINPENLKKREDFYNDYKNLVRGLDEDSIFLINKLLAKLLSIKPNKKTTDRVKVATLTLNKEDTDLIKKVEIDFLTNVLKLKNDCFVYKDYFLPIHHFEASVLYFKHGIDTLKNLNRIKSQNIIDVGGFIGDSAIVFSKYTDNKVYSFEPSQKNFDLMQKTIQLNNTTNIEPIKKGLGSKDEILYLNYDSSASYITADTNEVTERIEVTTLDSFVNENSINVGLIKVDIEGFEQEFLKGAENTIKTQKPALLLSIYHNFDDFFYIKPIIESWNLGYTFTIYAPLLNPLFQETLLIAEVK